MEVELEAGAAERRRDRLLEDAVNEALDESVATVGDVRSGDPWSSRPRTRSARSLRMRERDVGSALVADHGRLIGILTSRDMLRAFAGRVHSSEARVREWMTAEPIAVSAKTTLEAAAVLMAEHHIHHLRSSRVIAR